MFIGEAPGADEDRLGRPFVGAAGQLLDKMIVAMGFARDQVFIANILKCRPPGNRDPLEHEVAACLPYLLAQISLIRPEVICSLGRHASHALLGRKDPLGKLRGRFFDYRGTPLLPTFHPSYLLRTPADKGAAWKDLQLIMPVSNRPRSSSPRRRSSTVEAPADAARGRAALAARLRDAPAPPPPAARTTSPLRLTIAFTGDVSGYLEPCG